MMEMREDQNSGGQQPDAWESWAPQADQPFLSDLTADDPAAPDQRGDFAQPGEPGQPTLSSAAEQPGEPAQPSATQPFGHPQPSAGMPGYGQPSYGQPGYAQPGYGPPPGYPIGGGFGQPPGGQGPPPGYGRPPRRRGGLTTAVAYIAVAAVAAAIGGLAVGLNDSNTSPPSANSGTFGNPSFPGSGQQNNGGNSGSGSVSGAALQRVKHAVEPGLVIISSNLRYQGAGASAAATGMIISPNGLVLTNNHVINGTTGLTAIVNGTNKRYNAKWLGYSKNSDVAVIQLQNASGLKTVPLGNSDSVKLGDTVIGMGNAGGTGRIQAVAGTVTGLNQSITASDQGSGVSAERLTGMLQTNAQIIPGDSGGPLANLTGQVIGMDTAASTAGGALSGQQSQQDVGFAIPINKAMVIARQIIAGKSSSSIHIGASGFVGVLVPGGKNGSQSTVINPRQQLRQQEQADAAFGPIQPATNNCVPSNQQAGVPSKVAPVSSGTLVLGSLCGAPAAKVGLLPGDVITEVNGQRVSSPASLMSILQGISGGTTIQLTWVTLKGQTETQPLTLANAPPR
jgi:S1-C subfamily serine protease